jgi:hypothetical protein
VVSGKSSNTGWRTSGPYKVRRSNEIKPKHKNVREKAWRDRYRSAKLGNGSNPTEKLQGMTLHGGGVLASRRDPIP